jgi:hypothetical protein
MARMRARTTARAGFRPGQPELVLRDPKRIRSAGLTHHVCGWCGGPRSHHKPYRHRVLCHSCMRAEFGSAESYDAFIRSERARTLAAERRRRYHHETSAASAAGSKGDGRS